MKIKQSIIAFVTLLVLIVAGLAVANSANSQTSGGRSVAHSAEMGKQLKQADNTLREKLANSPHTSIVVVGRCPGGVQVYIFDTIDKGRAAYWHSMFLQAAMNRYQAVYFYSRKVVTKSDFRCPADQ